MEPSEEPIESAIFFLTEAISIIDKLYCLASSESAPGSGINPAAVMAATRHLGDNVDLAISELSHINESRNILSEILENLNEELGEHGENRND